MTLWMRRTIFLAGLLFAGSASAVSLSTDGSGQVLIFPYYTVNADQHSTLTLSNTSGDAKAVKLVFRSATAGNAAFVLNVYLGGGDTWTGTLFPWGSGASAGPALLSNDSSCTVPDLHADNLPTVPDGRHYLRPNAPGVATTPAALPPNEGYVVAIEMGVLTGASVDALKLAGPTASGPTDCGKLVAAWQADGYWRKDAATDISAPTGGLSGTMTILKVGEGTVFRVDATALKDFRVAAMNTPPDVTRPDLSDALSNAKTGVASANIPLGNKNIQSDYPADRTIDAVSAVLMAENFATKYDFRRSIGARTAFVITMPTKRFYAANKADIVAPFGRDAFHGLSPLGTLCPIVDIRGNDRSGKPASFYQFPPYYWRNGDGYEHAVPKPCYATSVLALAELYAPDSLLGSQLAPTVLNGGFTSKRESSQAGPAFLLMNYYTVGCYAGLSPDACSLPANHDYTRAHINMMRPDLEGRQYFGLPAVGFAATGYINAKVGGKAVLANYTFTSPYHRSRACVQNDKVGGCH